MCLPIILLCSLIQKFSDGYLRLSFMHGLF
uniref:Uncharacterized protein n=1 Tax=Rhizophora mucronata TaxID=61149 RepID=A0A2P2IY85_RHIMU